MRRRTIWPTARTASEDNDVSDIWAFDPQSKDADGDGYKDGVHLFASLKDKPAEGIGVYFGKDPDTLIVNVQHSGTGNDKTITISNCACRNDGKHDD